MNASSFLPRHSQARNNACEQPTVRHVGCGQAESRVLSLAISLRQEARDVLARLNPAEQQADVDTATAGLAVVNYTAA